MAGRGPMTPSLLAVSGPSPLWYLTRGTGLVALVLLTASMVLGILGTSRFARPGWPRFATQGLHRNVSLLVLVLLAIHILTAELDTFAPVGWLAVVVPFVSSYRPIWLGLGTLAFDLFLALILTSVLRARLGQRTWRVVHWLAYLSWPVALVHGLGTGTDSRLGWVVFVTVACIAAVVMAGAWRLAHGWPSRAGTRLAGGAAGALALVVLVAWTMTGPLRPGWAKRAGTPPSLLAGARALPASNGAASASGSPPTSSPRGAQVLPAPPFSASLSGHLSQGGPGSSGQVTIRIDLRMSGEASGILDITLWGQTADGGVALDTSTVSFRPAAAAKQYRGQVVALDGDQMVASVTSGLAPPLDLAVTLHIDPATGSVQGTLHAQRAAGSPGDGSSEGGGGQ
ncbi:MAG: ferric reductase-like transmembrane domain-containing protein [Acidimicrobiales bacterium]